IRSMNQIDPWRSSSQLAVGSVSEPAGNAASTSLSSAASSCAVPALVNLYASLVAQPDLRAVEEWWDVTWQPPGGQPAGGEVDTGAVAPDVDHLADYPPRRARWARCESRRRR